jgi:hypothetical protein
MGYAADAFTTESRIPVCSIALIESTSPAPDEDARSALSNFYREFSPKMAQTIVVAEGGGLRGALVRGVGAALSRLAPRRLPFKFVGDVDAACRLVEPHLSKSTGGASELIYRIASLRGLASAPLRDPPRKG